LRKHKTAFGEVHNRSSGKKDWHIITSTKAGALLHKKEYILTTSPIANNSDNVSGKPLEREEGTRPHIVPPTRSDGKVELSKHSIASPISDKVTGEQRIITPRGDCQWEKITGVLSPRPRTNYFPELTAKVNEVGRTLSPKTTSLSWTTMKITDHKREPLSSKPQGSRAPVAGKITNGLR
jgi:hypothetical protein